MSDERDELLGVTLAGRYWIISRLGAGGMGVAYRAWDERRGLPVVVKIPKRSFFADPKVAERFRREVRLLQGMSHPSIVPIVDVGEHDHLPFVVMRFLPGGSLSNRRLRDDAGNLRPNPPEMLHLWLPAVADALDYVHAHDVVHRDVKPANVFFDAYWAAFLGDFGIAKVLAESDVFDRDETLTGTNIGVGTQGYMSPEQFTPKATLDGGADQYALAVTVYEMVSGSRPFKGESAHVVVEVLTQAAPSLADRRPGLPQTLVEAVHRGLSKTSRERFATCREFAAAVLADVPRIADEPGVARLLCPQCNRILKLPVQAAGRKGSCPKCKGRMMVAADLGALWLVDEERHREAQDGGAVRAQAGRTDGVETDPRSVFQPLSDRTGLPVARRTRGSDRGRSSRGTSPWMVTVVGLLAVVMIVALAWRSPDQPNNPVVTSRQTGRLPARHSPASEPRPALQEPEPRLTAVEPQPAPPEPRLAAVEPQPAPPEPRPTVLEPQPAPPEPRPTAVEPHPVADPPVSDAQAEIVNAVGMKFKLMPPGEFQMGDPDGRPTEVPHKVTLTRPFFMGVHEVTNAQWQSVMKAWPREASKRLGRDFQRDNNPVVLVDWAAAKNFCDRLSSLEDEQQAGRRYRLPTSAEWEYACRAGTGTKYSFGDEAKHIGDHAWFFGNADQKTQAVGQKTPNPWGLFDMYGNVWEWCSDWRGPYRADAQTDPTGPASSELQQRVLRGGCFTTKPDSRQPTDPAFHSAARLGLFPAKFSDGIGFRVVFDSIEAASREAAAKPLEPAVPRSTVVTPAVGNPAPPPDPTAGAGEEGEEKATPIELALRWIADHQLPDGGWSFDLTTCAPCAGKCSHSGESKGPDRCGATAMALLPFLGRGYTHREGPYRKQIDKGLGFLVGMVTEGQGKAYGIGGSLYSQGLAAIVLSECLAMSGDDRLRAPAQAAIDFIVHAQDPAGGGWRYSPRQPGDTSSFGWQVTALHSGHLGGLKVSPLAVRKAITFLDSVQADDGAGYGYTSPGERPGTSAVGLLCRTYLGWNQNHPALRRGVAKLAAIGPTSDLYFDYYATRLMHYVEGDDWVAWNKRMKAMLVASQSTTGHEAGSWHDGVDGGHGASTAGRLYCTSLAAMILEIPYRWLPIYQRPVKAAAVQAR